MNTPTNQTSKKPKRQQSNCIIKMSAPPTPPLPSQSLTPLSSCEVRTKALQSGPIGRANGARSSPGLDVLEEGLPALASVPQRALDLGLPGLVAGRHQLLPQTLQVALVLAEQVDLLHAVLRRGDGTRSSTAHTFTRTSGLP